MSPISNSFIMSTSVTATSGNDASRIISNLEDYAVYRISITAIVNGALRTSVYLNGTTRYGAPSIVQNLTYSASVASLTFMWEDPPCEDINGHIDYYEYRIVYEPSGENDQEEIQTRNKSVSITEGLYPCSTYRFEVRIVIMAGAFSEWKSISATTGISAPAPVEETSIRVPGPVDGRPPITHFIDVSWTVSASSCRPDRFIIRYALHRYLACPEPEMNPIQLVETNETTYTLTDLHPYSIYNISITALNGVGESESSIVTANTGTDTPSTVRNLTYSASVDTLTFMWEDPLCEDINGQIDYYEYKISYEPSGENVQENIQTGNKLVSISEGLYPCSTYLFEVRIVIVAGAVGEWKATHATTGISVPAMPAITYITALQEDIGLNVTWTGPALTSTSCEPTNYEIHYQLLTRDSCEDLSGSTSMELAGSVDGSTFSFVIIGLHPYSEYRISVKGNTSAGYGPQHLSSGMTGYSYPSGSPLYITTNKVKKRSIEFTWEKPACGERNGPITLYDYVLYDSNGGPVAHGNTTNQTKEIDDLISYSNYSFAVRAVNYDLSGMYGPEVVVQTDEAKPGPPLNVRIPASDETSLTVEWQSPNPPEGKVIRYHIFYWKTENATLSSVANVTRECDDGACTNIAKVFQYVISDLTADTNYSVQVAAESIIGIGNESPRLPLIQLTSEGLPSAPIDVSLSQITKASITISWRQPEYPRGVIVGYKIAYKVTRRPYDSSFVANANFDKLEVVGDQLSYTFTSLDPATEYEGYVLAATKIGNGESSEHIRAVTEPPAPEDLPVPDIPVIQLSPDNTPSIQFNTLDSPFVTHVLVRVDRKSPANRRRRDSEVGSFQDNPNSYIAARVSKDELPLLLTVGDNQTYEEYYNAPLEEDVEYLIRTGVASDTGESQSTVFGEPAEYKNESKKPNSPLPIIVGILVAIVLLFAVVAAFVYVRYWRDNKSDVISRSFSRHRHKSPVNRNRDTEGVPLHQVPVFNPALNNGGTLQSMNMPSDDALCDDQVIHGEGGAPIYGNLPQFEGPHRPIPLDQLVKYVTNKKVSINAGFKQDYETIPMGQLHPWDIAKKPENKTKNRYINIVAYDHSRVLLTPQGNDPHSDYVNASFIDGYNDPQKYIASQGPNIASVKDFWRMVWEYEIGKIVMLTNLTEGEKRKCEKYWPDKKMQYGNVVVTMKNTEEHVHYTVRTLQIECKDMLREVVQFHYTSWPDMGVPKYTTPLMNFIRTTKLYENNSAGPIIVHCSAGVGRTGTFITLDSMLEQAETENVVDIYNFITRMRQQRIKMVQVAEQYEFIFDALMETFTCGDTSIAQDAFQQRYLSLLTPSPDTGSTVLQEQFERLYLFTIKPREDEQRAARNKMNVSKNRYRDKIPIDKSRPYLITEVENGTNYVNASFLPGYTKKDMFVGTQTPLPNTVIDFWRLVFDYKIATIIMLNGHPSEDSSMAQYWPDSSQCEVECGPFTITLVNDEQYDDLSCRRLELRSTASKTRVQTIYQLQLHTWPMTSDISSSPESIIELHRRALVCNEMNSEGAPILVHCKDGESATGTFCALSSILERLNVEKLVDVFQACKRLRSIRPGAVPTLTQYEFIHTVLRLYLDSYDIYENYRT